MRTYWLKIAKPSVVQTVRGCCQTNRNLSPLDEPRAGDGQVSGSKRLPLSQCDWETLQFCGTQGQAVNDLERQTYIANSYRVLLTRMRQGLVVFVPEGDENDPTRPSQVYDEIFNFLNGCGFVDIEAAGDGSS